MRRGLGLMAYLAASHCFPLVAPAILRKRRARDKEHPARWREKLGKNLAPRPDGPLIWLHAVGLGEVMSLRGLILRMAAADPALSFLVTSTTAASAQVFAANLPPRTHHQFLPIDAPRYRRGFLDHFRPDLAIWTEQDIWPGLVSDAARRGIPQAVIAARMNAASHAAHHKARSVYRDLYRAMALVTAQDQATADHLSALGAPAVRVTGSLKPACPPLTHDPDALARLQSAVKGRRIWATAPSHSEDETLALAANDMLRAAAPDTLLIIAPRDPARSDTIAATLPAPVKRRSRNALPDQSDPVWLCDTFGDLGLVYRLADTVLIGGTNGAIEGHNPWEAATLDTAILHGPRTGNFASDFSLLDHAGAARRITDAATLATALQDTAPLAAKARAVIAKAAASTDALADDLLALRRP